MTICPSCNGSRYALSFAVYPEPTKCLRCGGSGAILTYDRVRSTPRARIRDTWRADRLRLIGERAAAMRLGRVA